MESLHHVVSRDGTTIAYDQVGDGPALIAVNGALGRRVDVAPVAAALAPRFTVIAYDRRGRAASGDTQPYSVEREIEDLDAVITKAGGEAFVFGHSSGAAIALEAAIRGLAITKLALYEPPYIVDDSRPPVPDDFLPTLCALIAEGRPGDAVEYFWRVGVLLAPEVIAQLKAGPMWPGIQTLGHTVAYDAEVMGDHMRGDSLPSVWRSQVLLPTLVIDGGDSPAWMRGTAGAIADLLPDAERRTLAGQGHSAPAEVLAPVLEAFFLG